MATTLEHSARAALHRALTWLSLLVLLLGTVAASLLATAWPAIQATRIKPAVALRTTDYS